MVEVDANLHNEGKLNTTKYNNAHIMPHTVGHLLILMHHAHPPHASPPTCLLLMMVQSIVPTLSVSVGQQCFFLGARCPVHVVTPLAMAYTPYAYRSALSRDNIVEYRQSLSQKSNSEELEAAACNSTCRILKWAC